MNFRCTKRPHRRVCRQAPSNQDHHFRFTRDPRGDPLNHARIAEPKELKNALRRCHFLFQVLCHIGTGWEAHRQLVTTRTMGLLGRGQGKACQHVSALMSAGKSPGPLLALWILSTHLSFKTQAPLSRAGNCLKRRIPGQNSVQLDPSALPSTALAFPPATSFPTVQPTYFPGLTHTFPACSLWCNQTLAGQMSTPS